MHESFPSDIKNSINGDLVVYKLIQWYRMIFLRLLTAENITSQMKRKHPFLNLLNF